VRVWLVPTGASSVAPQQGQSRASRSDEQRVCKVAMVVQPVASRACAAATESPAVRRPPMALVSSVATAAPCAVNSRRRRGSCCSLTCRKQCARAPRMAASRADMPASARQMARSLARRHLTGRACVKHPVASCARISIHNRACTWVLSQKPSACAAATESLCVATAAQPDRTAARSVRRCRSGRAEKGQTASRAAGREGRDGVVASDNFAPTSVGGWAPGSPLATHICARMSADWASEARCLVRKRWRREMTEEPDSSR
jgi:hypothetical protein